MSLGDFRTPDGRHLYAPGLHLVWGQVELMDPDGRVVFAEDWQPNGLLDEGEQSLLDVYLRGQPTPAKYMCLLTGTPGETTTMTTMTEPFTPPLYGYSRKFVDPTEWSTPVLDAGDYRTQAVQKTFGPATTNAWVNLTHAALVTVAAGVAGKLLLTVPLSAPTTVAPGQTLRYTMGAKAA